VGIVVEPRVEGARGVASAYLGFLHDRLISRAPGITVVSICRAIAPGEFASVLTTSRTDVGNGVCELRFGIDPGLQAPAGRDLAFEFTRREVVEGAVVFQLPADLVITAETESRLRMFALVAASGLRLDLGPAWLDALESWPTATDNRDTRAGAHLERVAGYAHVIVRALAEPLGLSSDFGEAVFRYAPLHDIGQLVLAERILRKPGRLDADEWRTMQTHTTRGLEIIDDFLAESGADAWPRVDVLRAIVGSHHEALDGTGYPAGLSGDAVPLEARVMTVADVFDALTSIRPYKPGWSADEALGEMDRMVLAGKLDGLCLTALVTQPEVLESVAASGSEPPEDRR
jgi:HD-GYP domain-containing protein (c-di-GMP phosphodiesterase class II)